MMPRLRELLIAIVLMIAGTWFLGWWTVPIVGALWGFHRRSDAAVTLLAGAAGATAWGALLFWQSTQGPVARLVELLGTLLQVGPVAVLVLTVVYPGLLAASAAALVRALAPRS